MMGAVIGLAGAVFGAVTALVGSALSDRRRMRQEDIQWRRDQRVAAYEGALRHLLRAANMRSGLHLQGGNLTTVLSQEHMRDWFGDLVEAQFWMHTLISRCESAQSARMGDSTEKLDDAIRSLNAGRNSGKKSTDTFNPGGIFGALDEAIITVSKCAQLYMSTEAGNRWPDGPALNRSSALEMLTDTEPATE
jgi:hypothetical protein